MRQLLKVCSLIFITFLVFSFICWDWNVSNWSDNERALFSLITLGWGFLTFHTARKKGGSDGNH